MPHIRAHLDLPTLEALEAEWRAHPPTHRLVAAFLNYEPAAVHAGALHDEPADADDGGAGLAALLGHCKPLDAAAALPAEATEAERVAALERLFYGSVKDVHEL